MKVPLNKVTRLISPRIVVLVTTVDKEGRINAAPYSFFGTFSFDPPMLYIGVRSFQHTYQNIKNTGEFVINIVGEDFSQQAVDCEKRYPIGVNELEKVGLHWYDSEIVKAPRVKEAKVHLECKFVKEIDVGDHIIIVGEIVAADAEGLKDDYTPDLMKLKTIMHMTGEYFYSVGEEIKLERKK